MQTTVESPESIVERMLNMLNRLFQVLGSARGGRGAATGTPGEAAAGGIVQHGAVVRRARARHKAVPEPCADRAGNGND
jgi:hypothetical protein